MLALTSFIIGTFVVIVAPFIGVAALAAAGCAMTIGGAIGVSQS
jgi:hypothetical protein